MSLINQMLRDLDARRASGSELALVPRYVRSLPRAERPRVQWWWFAVAGAAIGVGGALAWQFMGAPAPAAPASQAVAPPPAASPEQAPPPQPPAAPVAQPSAVPPPAAPVAQPAPVPAPAPPFAQAAAAPTARADEAPRPPDSVAREAPAGFVPASALIAREMPGAAFRAPPIEPARTAKPPQAPVESAETSAPKGARASAAAREKAASPDVAGGPPQIDKRMQPPSPREAAETEFREGTALLHQGRTAEAQEKFRLALQHLPSHAAARQALLSLMIKAGKLPEAEQLLQDGLRNDPQPAFAMALARMQVDRGDTAGAVETLTRSAPAAAGRADYVAFLAALMQRQGRHAEAVEQYQTALGLAPGSGLWAMGLGISLQALQRNSEARSSYRRALASQTLSPELNAFVEQQMRLLQ